MGVDHGAQKKHPAFRSQALVSDEDISMPRRKDVVRYDEAKRRLPEWPLSPHQLNCCHTTRQTQRKEGRNFAYVLLVYSPIKCREGRSFHMQPEEDRHHHRESLIIELPLLLCPAG